MRPRRLVIEGFTAFRDRQDIDLTDLDLFAITGPTGAGKTSVFDAITLALYGRVPRIGSSQAVGRFISHGAGQAVVSLEFSVGEDVYRATRRYRLSGPNEVALERIVDGHPQGVATGGREVSERVTEILGMGYDAFQRAVLLPQGQFDRFLKGDPKQRREVLVGLLDLERYERAGQHARGEARNLGRTIEAHGSRLGALAHATPEARGAKADELSRAETRGEALGDALRDARAADAERVRARELASRLDGDAEVWRRASRDALALIGEVRDSRGDVAAARAALDRAEAALRDRSDEVAARDSERADVVEREGDTAAHASARAALRARGDELDRIQQMERALAAATERRSAARADLESRTSDRDRAAEAARAAEGERERRAAERDAAAAAEDRARRRAELLHGLRETEGRLDSAARRRSAAEEAARREREEAERAQAGYEALLRRHAAAGIRTEVHVGEDCPVCDRPIEAAPSVDAEAGDALEEGRRLMEEARRRAAAADADLREAAEEENRLAERSRGRREEIDRVGEAPAHEDARAALDAATSALGSASEALSAAAAAAERAADALGVAGAEAARAEADHEACEAGLRDARLRLEDADAELARVLGAPLPDDVAAELARREAALTEAETRLAGAREAERIAREERDAASRGWERVRDAEAEREQRLDRLRVEARVRLDGSGRGDGWPDLDEPPWPAGLGDLDESLATALERLGDRLAEAAGAARRRSRDAGERISALCAGSDVSPEAQGEEIPALERAHTAWVRAAERARNEMAQLDREIDERERLERTVEETRERAERLEWLGGHLRAGGFITYVISETLETLCSLAGARLEEMSEGRYALRADDDGSFQVIDHANADEARDVETLSGGETFLVSFALALALAESIADFAAGRGAALDAVFIDEGFSALDAESLEVALDALEAIGRTEERMVGLISHVERIPERIPEGLDVVKGDGRSHVRRREVEPA